MPDLSVTGLFLSNEAVFSIGVPKTRPLVDGGQFGFCLSSPIEVTALLLVTLQGPMWLPLLGSALTAPHP